MNRSNTAEEISAPTEWVRDHSEPDKALGNIDTLLAERETTYGSFRDHACISQGLVSAMSTGKWNDLSCGQKEALEMIAHKIARILNGNPDYLDNWVDIAGYAQLVVNILVEDAQA